MSYTNVIEDIQKLPHFRDFTCNQCGNKQKVYSLSLNIECKNCKAQSKSRGYASIGSEVEDVIDAVLEWLGTGEEFLLAMERKRIIDSD